MSDSLKGQDNKRLQRTGISVPLIDNLLHDAVVARPLKRDRWAAHWYHWGYLVMAKHILLLILLILVCPVNAFSQSSDLGVPRNVALCKRVAEIKELPKNYYTGVDATYDALIEAGHHVVPCLIEKVTDTRIMRDPRCPAISRATTVGDVAYFVLIDIFKIGFVELLPTDVQEKYKTAGVYAYHEHIETKGARKRLQARLHEWYRKQHPVN